MFAASSEVWWFGLVLLTRGPLLSMPAVAAPNMPAVQFVCLLGILSFGSSEQRTHELHELNRSHEVTYLKQLRLLSLQLQVWYQPWKAPILNLVDGVTNILLVMLLAVGLGRLDAGTDAGGTEVVLNGLAAIISAMMMPAYKPSIHSTLSTLICFH